MSLFTSWISNLCSSIFNVQPVGVILRGPNDSFEVLSGDGFGALKTSTTTATAALGSVATVAATATQFGATACQTGVLIQADLANTGICSIGDATLTMSNGIQLQGGDSVLLPVANTNQLYHIGTVVGGKLRVFAL